MNWIYLLSPDGASMRTNSERLAVEAEQAGYCRLTRDEYRARLALLATSALEQQQRRTTTPEIAHEH